MFKSIDFIYSDNGLVKGLVFSEEPGHGLDGNFEFPFYVQDIWYQNQVKELLVSELQKCPEFKSLSSPEKMKKLIEAAQKAVNENVDGNGDPDSPDCLIIK